MNRVPEPQYGDGDLLAEVLELRAANEALKRENELLRAKERAIAEMDDALNAARAKLEEYQKLWDYYHEFCIEHGADDITDMAVKLGKYKRDAERYRWLRVQQWNKSNLFVVAGGKERIKLSTDCPSLDRLDAAIDALAQDNKP